MTGQELYEEAFPNAVPWATRDDITRAVFDIAAACGTNNVGPESVTLPDGRDGRELLARAAKRKRPGE